MLNSCNVINFPGKRDQTLLRNVLDGVLFAVAHSPHAFPTFDEMKEALDDATGYELRDDQLEKLSRRVLAIVSG